MGFYICQGYCANCGRFFSFNPDRVPSVRVKGDREPVCKTCIDDANPKRVAAGLEPFTILPGAYEPASEHPLDSLNREF